MRNIPATVWVISIVTLLVNFSSVMIFSLTPIYITQVFGVAVFHLGILEGVIEFISWTIRIFSGIISDYIKKRKPLLIFAYTLTFLSRPFFVLAPNVVWIYGAKLIDRISNGLQATPREALIADVAPEELKGACYGLRQSLGVVGSLIGAAVVIGLMRISENDFRLIFWVACFPPLFALFALFFFVKEPPASQKGMKISLGQLIGQVYHLNTAFWLLILISGIFMTSNYGGVYRILLAEKNGMPVSDLSIVMVLQNLGVMVAAYPIGRLSDRHDRRQILAVGFCTALLANLCFCWVDGVAGVLIGTLIWGVQMGMNQSLLLSMVADCTPRELRGSAFGVYYLVNAFALFIANVLTGWLSQHYGSSAAFTASMALMALSLMVMVFVRQDQPIRNFQ